MRSQRLGANKCKREEGALPVSSVWSREADELLLGTKYMNLLRLCLANTHIKNHNSYIAEENHSFACGRDPRNEESLPSTRFRKLSPWITNGLFRLNTTTVHESTPAPSSVPIVPNRRALLDYSIHGKVRFAAAAQTTRPNICVAPVDRQRIPAPVTPGQCLICAKTPVTS